LNDYETLIERKSRVPQLQGVQGWRCSCLPQTLGNAEDDKQNGIWNGHLHLTFRRIENYAQIM